MIDAFERASDAVKTAALAIAMSESRVNVLFRDVQLAERVVSALNDLEHRPGQCPDEDCHEYIAWATRTRNRQ